jgi:hypothetical protein
VLAWARLADSARLAGRAAAELIEIAHLSSDPAHPTAGQM